MSRILDVARRSDEITPERAQEVFEFCCVHVDLDPTVRDLHELAHGPCTGIHASLLRSYQALELVKAWLAEGVPPKVVLELIEHIEELAAEHEAKGETT